VWRGVYQDDQAVSGRARIDFGVYMITAFSLSASFLAWVTAANIVRVTGAAKLQHMGTLLTGFIALCLAHVSPIVLMGWLFGAGLIVVSYIVAGVLNGIYFAGRMCSENWPYDTSKLMVFGPVVFFTISLVLQALIWTNHLK
jgi:hypothetical protein